MLMLLPAVWSEARARRWRTVVRIDASRSHCGGDFEPLICWQPTIWRSFDLSNASTSMINSTNWAPLGREGHRGLVGQNAQPGDSCQPEGPLLKETMMDGIGKIKIIGSHVALQKSERADSMRQYVISVLILLIPFMHSVDKLNYLAFDTRQNRYGGVILCCLFVNRMDQRPSRKRWSWLFGCLTNFLARLIYLLELRDNSS